MPDLAVSTWSLHRLLGRTYPGLDLHDGPRRAEEPYGPGSITLLDVPAVAADLGVQGLDICHFHFPRTDAAYLDEFRSRLADAAIYPSTLLVDDGDITAADEATRQRDIERIQGWIDIAVAIGARRVRVVAGESAPDQNGDAVRRSVEGLSTLAAYGRERGVAVITENWKTLASRPETLLAILDGLDGAVGLCADFGNFTGPAKYDDLQAILPYATTIHAKAHFTEPGEMEEVDFRTCLDLARSAGFSGPYVLIFEGPGDERTSLAQMAAIVRAFL